MRQCHAFTLVEMLFALVVLLVLIGILIPTISAARRRAGATHCASNLRQLGQALAAYRSEGRNWPLAQPMPAPFTAPLAAGWPTLVDLLAPYASRSSGHYRCPFDSEDGGVFGRCVATSPERLGISYVYLGTPRAGWAERPVMHDYLGDTIHRDVARQHPAGAAYFTLYRDGSVSRDEQAAQ